MGQQSKVSDADESRRQHMQQESPQKFVDAQRHQTLLILVSGIAPAESDGAVGEGDQAMVRDRDAMGVLAQIAKCVLRAAERTFGVNHPFGAEQRTKPGGERFGIGKPGSVPWKPSLCSACSSLR